jgi:hypothetical protein
MDAADLKNGTRLSPLKPPFFVCVDPLTSRIAQEARGTISVDLRLQRLEDPQFYDGR